MHLSGIVELSLILQVLGTPTVCFLSRFEYATNTQGTDGRLQRDYLPTIKRLPRKSLREIALISHMHAPTNRISSSER